MVLKLMWMMMKYKSHEEVDYDDPAGDDGM